MTSTNDRFLRLNRLGIREIEQMLVRGETPDPNEMAGWEYRGLNVLPFTRLVGIKKFMKGFYKNAAGKFFGYNVKIDQTVSLRRPWTYQGGRPKRFGFYRVDAVDPTSADNKYLHSVLLDYSRAGNKPWDPTVTLRDYCVRVEKGSDEIILGKAYVVVGPLQVPGGYFFIERHQKTEYSR